ncbi:hypothetical protein [Bradyrhizobium sp. SZCCHNS3053]|uniref:hypothetical protein n=1 Tax=Bradyrhizobium sp. SZCCHNS3053 TaxID=3057322 RepID=UPI002916EB60|nr:hypothetical protein [Bradyrhizobium sp. SZCCHNS3053]
MPAVPHNPDHNNVPTFGLDDFREYVEIEAFMHDNGWVDWHHAVDTCEWAGELWGLKVEARQAVMAEVFGRFHEPEMPPDDIPLAPEPPRRSYRTPQSTVDAFWHVVRSETTDSIAEWLARHPRDADHLHKLWKAKACSTAA